MAFLTSGTFSKFLGVDDNDEQQQSDGSIPTPYPRLQFSAPKTGAQPASSSASTQDTPEASDPTTPTGPTTATQPTATKAPSLTTTPTQFQPHKSGTIQPNAKGVTQIAGPAAGDAQLRYTPDTKEKPQVTYASDQQADDEQSAAPTVQADRGDRTTDRDPVTGVVRDRDANNKPEETIAKTFVDENGVVHYASQNPDGSPKEPWADEDGWGQLTEAQQDAALQDYYDRLVEWRDNQEREANGPGPALGPDFDQLDPAAKISRLDDYFAGKTADGTPQQRIEVDEDGTLHYTQFDADGNLIPPWNDAEGWAALSPEQQQLLREHYADALEAQAQQADAESQPGGGYAGLGMSEEQFNGYPPSVQAEILRTGQKPPTQNVDGSWTYANTDGSSVVKDTQGNVLSKTDSDGTVTSYGSDGAQTITSPDGTVTTIDNQGNKTVKYKEGSEQAQAVAARTKAGFSDDGQPISMWDQYVQAGGADGQQTIDPQNPTPKQRDEFEQFMANGYQQMWSQGAAYAQAAVNAGLITGRQFNDMANSDYAHSFGAWLMNNRDIMAALENSNIEIPKDNLPSPTNAQIRGSSNYADTSDYFAAMRGDTSYMDPQALTTTDYDSDMSFYNGVHARGQNTQPTGFDDLDALRQYLGISDPSRLRTGLSGGGWQT